VIARRQYAYQLLNVFTTTRFEGNPLAVLPSADGITDVEMQNIAGEFNLSETVFLLKPTDPAAAAQARIFTPRKELPFAGYPTIGSGFLIATQMVDAPSFVIEEKVGPIRIDTDKDARGNLVVWLTTPAIYFFETLDRDVCSRLLGLSPDKIRADCQPQFVSAGTPLLFVCLEDPEAVDRAELRNEYLPEALGSVNSVGTFLFARKDAASGTNLDVYSRMFAPQIGIVEDPATGGAAGPLAAYMLNNALLPQHRDLEFTSEQGTKMGRRSFLHVRVRRGKETVIQVGGSVIKTGEGVLMLDTGAN
jgi:trans-2,3-dihydro-3-hydroxyanthranilate isomerase